jgi:hypothetical protein
VNVLLAIKFGLYKKLTAARIVILHEFESILDILKRECTQNASAYGTPFCDATLSIIISLFGSYLISFCKLKKLKILMISSYLRFN